MMQGADMMAAWTAAAAAMANPAAGVWGAAANPAAAWGAAANGGAWGAGYGAAPMAGGWGAAKGQTWFLVLGFIEHCIQLETWTHRV